MRCVSAAPCISQDKHADMSSKLYTNSSYKMFDKNKNKNSIRIGTTNELVCQIDTRTVLVKRFWTEV